MLDALLMTVASIFTSAQEHLSFHGTSVAAILVLADDSSIDMSS